MRRAKFKMFLIMKMEVDASCWFHNVNLPSFFLRVLVPLFTYAYDPCRDLPKRNKQEQFLIYYAILAYLFDPS